MKTIDICFIHQHNLTECYKKTYQTKRKKLSGAKTVNLRDIL